MRLEKANAPSAYRQPAGKLEDKFSSARLPGRLPAIYFGGMPTSPERYFSEGVQRGPPPVASGLKGLSSRLSIELSFRVEGPATFGTAEFPPKTPLPYAGADDIVPPLPVSRQPLTLRAAWGQTLRRLSRQPLTPWCNGSTRVFEALCHGSNPCGVACFCREVSGARFGR